VPGAGDRVVGGLVEPKSHYLYPGALFVHPEPHLVTTVLGSCVAVCLWEPQLACGGINHFLLPLWNGEGLPTPRYGNVAIPLLVEQLTALGARRERLQAKLFGGASMWQGSEGLLAVGERNIALARTQLGELHVPILAADVGGTMGRKLVFNSGTGEVLLRRNRNQARPAD
jgi:chemotaxis protein CheD